MKISCQLIEQGKFKDICLSHETFTGTPGKYVSLKDTITGFQAIVNGDYDDLPEQAFYMIGEIEEAKKKADEI